MRIEIDLTMRPPHERHPSNRRRQTSCGLLWRVPDPGHRVDRNLKANPCARNVAYFGVEGCQPPSSPLILHFGHSGRSDGRRSFCFNFQQRTLQAPWNVERKPPLRWGILPERNELTMKTTAVLALILASATAFNQPLFATRAVGAKAPVAKKAAPVAKKAAPVAKVAVKKAAPVAKKAAPVAKVAVKKVAPVAKKAAPVAKKAAPVAKKAAPVAKPVVKKVVAKAAPAKTVSVVRFRRELDLCRVAL